MSKKEAARLYEPKGCAECKKLQAELAATRAEVERLRALCNDMMDTLHEALSDRDAEEWEIQGLEDRLRLIDAGRGEGEKWANPSIPDELKGKVIR
jgi:hypothetical protein